jgi:hypothetical protein
MSSELQKKLYEMEVTPPAAVWENLAASLDEINADNAVAKKLSTTSVNPPAEAWNVIETSLVEENKIPATKKVIPINFRWMAVAAMVAGIAIAGWLLLRNGTDSDGEISEVTNPAIEQNPGKKDEQVKKETQNTAPLSNDVLVSVSPKKAFARRQKVSNRKQSTVKENRNEIPGAANEAVVLQKTLTGTKSFDKPIDDLSLVTAGDKYMTMVNANGRLSKIPVELAHLAPHLQDKPVEEDYFEILFGEGAFWKETLSEWRKKVATVPVSSGDAFTSFIELLKTVQNK